MAKPASNSPAPENTSGSADDLITEGKGRPTPTRREREAANLRPLVSSDRKASSKAARAKYSEAREKARIGMAAGEEKYLPERDKGPQRRFIRDYVDARFSVGELIFPLMIIIILLTMIENVEVRFYSFVGMWFFVMVAIIDCVVAGYIVNRKLAQKQGKAALQKGNRWYTAMRCLQMRPLRLPKPQVRRGKYPA